MAAEDDDIEVKIQLRDELSVPAREAAESLDELERAAKRCRRELALLQTQSAATGRTMSRTAVQVRQYNNAIQQQTQQLQRLQRQHQQVTQAQNTHTQALTRHTRATRDANRGGLSFRNTLRFLTRTIALTTTGLGYLTAAMVVLSAVSHLVAGAQGLGAVLNSLGSLASFAAFIPTALGSMIAIFATLAVALKGVGEGISAVMSGDMNQLNETLKNLAPSARTFLLILKEFAPQFKLLQKIVQETFFAEFANNMRGLLKNILPLLTKGMALVASAAGLFVNRLITFFNSDAGKKFVSAFFIGAADLLDGLTNGLLPVLEGISALLVAVAPMWADFAQVLGSLMAQFGDWLKQISTDGTLQAWIESGIHVFTDLLSILRSVWTIFMILLGGMGDGVGILDHVADLLRTVVGYLSSAEGQDTLKAVFDGLAAVMKVLSPIFTIFAKALLTVVLPSLIAIITNLAPGFTIFLQALADGLALITPYWPIVAKAIGDVLAALSPLLPILGELIGVLAGGLAQALTLLAGVIGPVLKLALVPLITIFSIIGELMLQRGPMIQKIVDAISDAFGRLTPFVQRIADIFMDQFINNVLPQWIALGEQMLPVILDLIAAFGDYFVAALEELMPYMPELIEAFFQILTAFWQIYPAMIPIIQAFIKLIEEVIIPNMPTWLFLIEVLITLAIIFLKLLAVVITFAAGVLAELAPVIAFFIGAWGALYDHIIAPFLGAIKWIFDNFLNPLRNGISDALDKLQGLFDKLTNNPLGNFLGGVFGGRWMGGPVEGGKSYMTGELGPEIFVDKQGNTRMLGEYGPQVEHFTSPGTVIPNHLVDSFENMRETLRRTQERTRDRAAEAVSSTRGSQQTVTVQGGNSYQIEATFTGNVGSDVDVERAIRTTIRKIEREKKERR
jgi:prefoldin subunit 5